MQHLLTDRDWDLLLKRINKGNCTPFLGAGVCYGVLPLGAEIAKEWVEEYGYPEKECKDQSIQQKEVWL